MANAGPLVTVAMCLHNSRPFIDATLASVHAQSFTDVEVLLVDDGSTDGTPACLLPSVDGTHVRLVQRPHGGLGAARATATAEARGRYIAWLDHDDLWEPDKLARQVDLATSCLDAGLLFSACRDVDVDGRDQPPPDHRPDPAQLNLSAGHAAAELLQWGCFIDLSSAFVPRDVLRQAGGFDPTLRFIEDYDLWLRIARRWPLVYDPLPLVRRRQHAGQFTRQHPDVAVDEHRHLLRPLLDAGTYPAEVRRAVAVNLAGDHCAYARRLFEQRRLGAGLAATTHGCRVPGGLRYTARYWWDRIGHTGASPPVNAVRAPRPAPSPVSRGPALGAIREIWFDATPLDSAQTGYFTFTLELLRALLAQRPPHAVVHADVPAPVVPSLAAWLGPLISRLVVHRVGPALDLRRPHERRLRGGGSHTLEVLNWVGRFRWSDSIRLAVVHDVTPRLMPAVHTEGNIRDFDDYARYVTRFASHLVTLSQASRRDIIEHLPVYPPHVEVVPARIHPRFASVPAAADVVRIRERLGLDRPYVLSVGTAEPRKNLRRLVDAFALTMERIGDGETLLALAGPDGWDATFAAFVDTHPAATRVRRLGFVPPVDLPSLYAGCRVFAYPSLYEGFGLPVFEALACGASVVAGNVGAVPEVVGRAGRLVDPHSVDDIAAGLEATLAADPTDRRRQRETALARAAALRAASVSVPPLPGLSAWA